MSAQVCIYVILMYLAGEYSRCHVALLKLKQSTGPEIALIKGCYSTQDNFDKAFHLVASGVYNQPFLYSLSLSVCVRTGFAVESVVFLYVELCQSRMYVNFKKPCYDQLKYK